MTKPTIDGKRQCSHCHDWKVLIQFDFRIDKQCYGSWCKTCKCDYRKEDYKKNHDKHRAIAKSRYISTKIYRGKCVETGCENERGRTQPLCKKHYGMAYYREHPELKRAQDHRRRAKIRQSFGNYTISEWNQLCELYHNVCLCCGQQNKLTVDHIVPIALGGSNDISNIQPLCGLCNSIKGTAIIDYR